MDPLNLTGAPPPEAEKKAAEAPGVTGTEAQDQQGERPGADPPPVFPSSHSLPQFPSSSQPSSFNKGPRPGLQRRVSMDIPDAAASLIPTGISKDLASWLEEVVDAHSRKKTPVLYGGNTGGRLQMAKDKEDERKTVNDRYQAEYKGDLERHAKLQHLPHHLQHYLRAEVHTFEPRNVFAAQFTNLSLPEPPNIAEVWEELYKENATAAGGGGGMQDGSGGGGSHGHHRNRRGSALGRRDLMIKKSQSAVAVQGEEKEKRTAPNFFTTLKGAGKGKGHQKEKGGPGAESFVGADLNDRVEAIRKKGARIFAAHADERVGKAKAGNGLLSAEVLEGGADSAKGGGGKKGEGGGSSSSGPGAGGAGGKGGVPRVTITVESVFQVGQIARWDDAPDLPIPFDVLLVGVCDQAKNVLNKTKRLCYAVSLSPEGLTLVRALFWLVFTKSFRKKTATTRAFVAELRYHVRESVWSLERRVGDRMQEMLQMQLVVMAEAIVEGFRKTFMESENVLDDSFVVQVYDVILEELFGVTWNPLTVHRQRKRIVPSAFHSYGIAGTGGILTKFRPMSLDHRAQRELNQQKQRKEAKDRTSAFVVAFPHLFQASRVDEARERLAKEGGDSDEDDEEDAEENEDGESDIDSHARSAAPSSRSTRTLGGATRVSHRSLHSHQGKKGGGGDHGDKSDQTFLQRAKSFMQQRAEEKQKETAEAEAHHKSSMMHSHSHEHRPTHSSTLHSIETISRKGSTQTLLQHPQSHSESMSGGLGSVIRHGSAQSNRAKKKKGGPHFPPSGSQAKFRKSPNADKHADKKSSLKRSSTTELGGPVPLTSILARRLSGDCAPHPFVTATRRHQPRQLNHMDRGRETVERLQQRNPKPGPQERGGGRLTRVLRDTGRDFEKEMQPVISGPSSDTTIRLPVRVALHELKGKSTSGDGPPARAKQKVLSFQSSPSQADVENGEEGEGEGDEDRSFASLLRPAVQSEAASEEEEEPANKGKQMEMRPSVMNRLKYAEQAFKMEDRWGTSRIFTTGKDKKSGLQRELPQEEWKAAVLDCLKALQRHHKDHVSRNTPPSFLSHAMHVFRCVGATFSTFAPLVLEFFLSFDVPVEDAEANARKRAAAAAAASDSEAEDKKLAARGKGVAAAGDTGGLSSTATESGGALAEGDRSGGGGGKDVKKGAKEKEGATEGGKEKEKDKDKEKEKDETAGKEPGKSKEGGNQQQPSGGNAEGDRDLFSDDDSGDEDVAFDENRGSKDPFQLAPGTISASQVQNLFANLSGRICRHKWRAGEGRGKKGEVAEGEG
uniref:Uncharacterized protein n=1 Tax=Chromera velia CCMP2878 TaxID=1169474 RepID=A0A0G4F4W7_9ALVE|eukprot:Cvel_15052.t1-p1 / transcript=Cvel_15052.t1 / gene=Cvel_15052 / organism=Chromera_velia_CCMP2878 / gene_product=hypothetical protein / transcript_product=hypothetical protein / location=Cvel_scaffold1096:17977-25612(-) / protein_length=1294 / sequence_SO=supercontig / SO=protein_coding / is_pseudo=false